MAFIPFPAGCVEAVLKGRVDGIPVVNTIGARYLSGSATIGDGSNLAAELISWWHTNIAPLVSATLVILDEVTVYDLTSASGWVANDPDPHPGTGSAASVPNNVAMTVTFSTALRGRSYRGRNYVPGLPSGALVNQLAWDTAITSAVEGAYTALPTAMNSVGFGHVVLSRHADHAPRTLGVATTVSGYRANAPIATMRRRLT